MNSKIANGQKYGSHKDVISNHVGHSKSNILATQMQEYYITPKINVSDESDFDGLDCEDLDLKIEEQLEFEHNDRLEDY